MNKQLSYIIPILLITGLFFGSRWMFNQHQILFDISLPIISVVIISLHINIVKFIQEFNMKQTIRKQFQSYLSPEFVSKLIEDPSLLKLGGEEKVLTILFSDVRGFTSISEHYGKDVQGLTKIMNRYMTAMTAKIIENEGTLDKYIGDAQMAFWNAPLDDSNHAKHAVKTALSMLGDLDRFNKEVSIEGVPAFGMGLGINTAVVVVGNMGSTQRFDYTCLGDGVNLAARLEGQSKPYGVKIVLGPDTAEQIKDEYFILELDCIAVKGKKEGVNIFTVLETDSNSMAEYLLSREHHDLMLDYYREQKWHSALHTIENLKGEFDGHMDAYYDMMIERIGELRESNLPNDWDSVYRATGK
jgi:adenylate cyclase